MEYTNEQRQAIERHIVIKVIDAMLAAGYSLGINDGEETTIHHSTDKNAILKAMFTTDEEYLMVYSPVKAKEVPLANWYFGWVRLVYGNDGWDVIADNTERLNPILAPVEEWADDRQTAAILSAMLPNQR